MTSPRARHRPAIGLQRRATTLSGLLAILLAACGERTADANSGTLPLHRLALEPSLEIGDFDGGSTASFERIASIDELPDGRLLVADGGAQRIAVFDADGGFVRDWGRRGEGPGEFRDLARAYSDGGRILAFDARGMRVSTYSLDGELTGRVDAFSLSGDSVFTMDVWLHGRFWVEGGFDPRAREEIRATLDRLPLPAGGMAYRFVRWADDGDLWVREPWSGVEAPSRWTIVDRSGQTRFALDVPARFIPLRATATTVDGRWLGAGDVNYVRRYAIEDTNERVALPDWLASADPLGSAGEARPTAGAETAAEAASLEAIRASTRALAVAQEIHYSQAASYSSDASALDFDLPPEVSFDIIEADDRGWSMVVGHTDLDRICGLGYGASTPPGWAGGTTRCGR